MPLTVKQIEALKPGPKRQEFADGGSLWYVLEPSGAASYVVRYRNAEGRLLKFRLGPASRLSLKQARAAATRVFAEIGKGHDPQTERVAARKTRHEAKPLIASDVIDTIAKRFLAEHVRPNLRPRTILEVERHIKRIIKAFAGRRLSEISRADIRVFLQGVGADAPIAANHNLSWFKRLCSWAIEQDLIEVSPAAGIKPLTPKTSRDRVLSHDEIRAVWEAAQALGYPYGAFVKMLLLTGQRRTECAGLKWSELDLQHKVWVLPADRSKNRTEHMVPLSEATLDLLKAVPRAPGVDYVFAFDKLPVNDFAGAKRQLDDALLLDLPQWQFHDLRRSFASELARLRVPPHVIEACLNHRSGIVSGISKTYNRYSYLDEKIVAMNAWARELDAIVHGRAETNVVSLR